MNAPSSLREWSHKPSTGPFISSHFSTQLLWGNNFNAGTWPKVFFYFPPLNPTGLSLAEPQSSLLRKCPRARESKGADGWGGGTGEGCVTPSDWSELAPEGLLYMEKWKYLNNHVRKLEESTFWERGSSYLEEFQPSALISQALSVWSMYGKEGCIDSAELKLFWDSALALQLISSVLQG